MAEDVLRRNNIKREDISEAEVLFLNDFRWSANIIPWHDFLLLLEGQEVHLPAPKTHFKQDISFKGDTPIFCTAKDEIALVRGSFGRQGDRNDASVMADIFSVFPNSRARSSQCAALLSLF